MIIRIFGQRAKTKEAMLQVELAKLQYSLPRQLEADGLKKMKKPTDGDTPEEEDEALALAKKLGKNAANIQQSSKTLEHYM